MSLDMHLEVEGLTDDNVVRLVEFSAGAGTWPLHGRTSGASRRNFLAGRQPVGPGLGVAGCDDEGTELFVEGETEPDGADTWAVARAARSRFRATLNLLSEELAGGFSFRIMWIGEPVRRVEVLGASELADRAESPGLREDTRYTVFARFT